MTLSCEEIRKLIIERHSGEHLSPAQREALKNHLALCSSCQAFQSDISLLFDSLKSKPVPPLPEAFFEDMREKVIDAVASKVPWHSSARQRLSAFLRPALPRRTVLTPALTGIVGIFIGISITTAWMHPKHPVTTPVPLAQNQKAPLYTASISSQSLVSTSDASDTTEIFEEYADAGDLLDAVGDQELKTLISQWSNKLPGDILDDTSNEAG